MGTPNVKKKEGYNTKRHRNGNKEKKADLCYAEAEDPSEEVEEHLKWGG